MIRLFFIICTVFIFHCHAWAQLKKPDSIYFNRIKVADSIISNARQNRFKDSSATIASFNIAMNMYIALSDVYLLTINDAQSLAQLALLLHNPLGLKNSIMRLVVLTGKPISTSINKLKESTLTKYGSILSLFNWQNNSSMTSMESSLLSKEDSLLQIAYKKFDLDAAFMITKMVYRDIAIRSLESELFKDSSEFDFYDMDYHWESGAAMGKTIAMYTIDSINLTEFYQYLQNNPFPGESISGEASGILWITLKHATSLLSFSDASRREPFIKMWKYILPMYFEASLDGESYYYRYQYVYDTLLLNAKGKISEEDYQFFLKYKNNL